jgi:Mlc titration factor MtfA (ptsG expression regulator)
MFARLRRWLGLAPAPVPVAEGLWEAVEARLPFLDFLAAADRLRLREMAKRFLASKQFYGAQGLQLTDDILLGIALQACLPVLNIGLDAYRGWIGVVVYPGDFVIPRREMDDSGVVHEYDDEVLGEAWEGGPVLLSWFDDSQAPYGVNVVIHEFAHKLDMANGGVDGLPALPTDMSRAAWAKAFSAAYDDFCTDVDAGRDTLLDPYGAEHPGEFFAVASEAFFETPCALQARYPEVYRQLARYYRLDPASGERTLAQGSMHGR